MIFTRQRKRARRLEEKIPLSFFAEAGNITPVIITPTTERIIFMNTCPCKSGKEYSACCQAIISGARLAATAEELMRARYSAHTGVQIDFILASTHPDHRQEFDRQTTQEWAEKTTWLGLEILDTTQGGKDDNTGEVEFIARFREKEQIRAHHERAQFRREEGIWYFTDGTMVKPQPLVASKIGRNDPCSCGSGRKHKKCCGQ